MNESDILHIILPENPKDRGKLVSERFKDQVYQFTDATTRDSVVGQVVEFLSVRHPHGGQQALMRLHWANWDQVLVHRGSLDAPGTPITNKDTSALKGAVKVL